MAAGARASGDSEQRCAARRLSTELSLQCTVVIVL